MQIVRVSFVRTVRRVSVIALALLSPVGYAASIADADDGLCFGRDGHVAVESSSAHTASSSADTALGALVQHGACVDVHMAARDAEPPPAIPPARVGALTAGFENEGSIHSVPHGGGRPLPHFGFGSCLLRI